jgi:predicted DNA binding CopG/RHH family protein
MEPMIKKYPTLEEINAEEKELMKLIESDDYVPPTNELTQEKANRFQAIARATLNEERTKISLRLRSSDLRRLKERASKEGMPYQTLIGSILHKAVS